MDTQESGPIEQPSVLDRIEATLTTESEPVEPTEDEVQASAEPAAQEAEEAEPEGDEPEGAEVEAAESDESEGPEQDGDQPDEPPKYTVKVDGEEREVTVDELLKGFMMQQDYTRKTQQLSEQQKEFEQASQQQLAQYAEKLHALDSLLNEQQQSVNWDELREMDPSEYMRQKELAEQRKQKLEQGRQELAEQRQQRLQQLREQEQEALRTKVPEWLDPDVAKQEAAEVRAAFTDYGFNKDEVSSVLDHRLIHMARDLAKTKAELEKVKSRASEVKEQVQKAAPLTKPRTTTKSDPDIRKQKALKKQMRSGKRGAVAAYLEDLL